MDHMRLPAFRFPFYLLGMIVMQAGARSDRTAKSDGIVLARRSWRMALAKLGRACVARTDVFIPTHESGGGGPRVGAVEGA